jgi:hypothetical protein
MRISRFILTAEWSGSTEKSVDMISAAMYDRKKMSRVVFGIADLPSRRIRIRYTNIPAPMAIEEIATEKVTPATEIRVRMKSIDRSVDSCGMAVLLIRETVDRTTSGTGRRGGRSIPHECLFQ